MEGQSGVALEPSLGFESAWRKGKMLALEMERTMVPRLSEIQLALLWGGMRVENLAQRREEPLVKQMGRRTVA